MSQSGSPHRSRRKDNMSQQGSRDGSGQYSRNVGSKSSNPAKSSSLATKSDKAHGSKHFSNGGSSGGSSGSHEIKVSRSPQSYTNAVSRYSDSDNDGPSERTHYIAMNLIGQQVRAVLKDGTVYEGLFHNPIFDRGFGVVLHMARKKESGDSGVIRTPPIDQVTVQPQDLVMLDAPEVAFVEDSAEFKKQMMREGGFRTDTEISGRDFSERELVPWLPPEEAGGMGGLEDEAGARNRWDQFEANERLFGVRTTYDERFYTTEIDRQRVSREVVEKAIRIEREIKFQTTSNTHLAEERGLVAPKDDTEDEEDKYSSVIREQKGPGPKFGKGPEAKGGSAYVVPAKRKQGDEVSGQGGEERRKTENDRDKAREHELKKQRQRELEIEREREREREKEKEREKARQRERERIDRERAAKGLPPSSPSSNLSRSATSIANLADDALAAERPRAPASPRMSSLSNSPFRQRSFSMSNLSAATAPDGSPAAAAAAAAAGNLDPDDPQYIEKLRVRQKLLAEMRSQGVEPRAAPEKLKAEPFHSPMVGHPEQIKSLDLSPAVPRVSESVLNEFKQYKDRKRSLSNASPAVPSKQDMVNFSKEIEKKTSAPNSPALRARRGEHQIAPSPLSPRHVLDATAAKLEKEGETPSAKATTSTSTTAAAAAAPAASASATATPATTPASATPATESPASTSTATTPRKGAAETPTATAATTAAAASSSTDSKPAATEGAAAAAEGSQPPLSKIQLPSLKSKLNPFAKAFTPKRPAAAAAPAAEKPAGASPPGSVGKPTVDINIPVSSFFSQGMRRLQDNPEDPEQVAPVWPYGRVPYRQEDAGMPMEGYPYPPVPTMSPIPPQGRPMGYPVPYVTSPPPQMGTGQPVMMFPPGQPVPRGFVPQGSIPGGPGVAYYPGGPAGQPYPPHIYSAPPGAVPAAAGGPMGHKGRMGPYPGPHGHVPPHSPHAPPHSPQGNPQRAGGPQGAAQTASPGGQPIPLAGGPPPQAYSAQFPPNSPPAYAVPPGEHGAPHSPHAQPASPHSPHAPRAQPHMVPVSPTQPIYSFPPAPHILGDPLAVPPGRGPHQQIPQQPMVVPGMAPRGGYRYPQGPQGPPPQMSRGGGGGAEYMNARPEGGGGGGGAPNKSPAQAQPFHPRQGNPNINAGAFYPGQQQQQQQQQRGSNQSRGASQGQGAPQQQQQQQDKDGGQRFKVPNTDVLPQQ